MLRQELWNYFKAIESDLFACQRFVHFSPANFDTYSSEFAKITLLAGSEVDSVLRDFCAQHAAKANIKTYEAEIEQRFPFFKSQKLSIKGTALVIQPWEDWTQNKSPTWWKDAYNKLKHQRSASFERATLQNALMSVGALYIVLLHVHHGHLHLQERREMVESTLLFMPINNPEDVRFEYAFAGSPYDVFDRGA